MMDAIEIRRLLPHRYPFLMVDRVSDIEAGNACVGEKQITLNEPCYRNLDDNINSRGLRYPLSLQLESFAQVGALLVLASRERIDVDEEYVMLAGSVRGMKVQCDVMPGDLMRHHVYIVKEFSDTVVIGGTINVMRPGCRELLDVAAIDSVVIAVRPREALLSSGGAR